MHEGDALREREVALEDVEARGAVDVNLCDAVHHRRDGNVVVPAWSVNKGDVEGACRYNWGW